MFKRPLNLLSVGAVASVASLGAVISADAGGCGGCRAPMAQPVYYAPPPPPPQVVYVPLPTFYIQPTYSLAPPLCAPRRSWLGDLFATPDHGQCFRQPAPMYIVNQGPSFDGPNLTVYPPPMAEPAPQPYPVVGPGGYAPRRGLRVRN